MAGEQSYTGGLLRRNDKKSRHRKNDDDDDNDDADECFLTGDLYKMCLDLSCTSAPPTLGLKLIIYYNIYINIYRFELD